MRKLHKLNLKFVGAEDCMEGNVRGRMMYRDEAQKVIVKVVTYRGNRSTDTLFKVDGGRWYRDAQEFRKAFESGDTP